MSELLPSNPVDPWLCVVCGLRFTRPSMGGPGICPSCDCGNSGPQILAAQKAEIDRLTDRVAELEALNKAAEESDRESCEMFRRARDERDRLRAALMNYAEHLPNCSLRPYGPKEHEKGPCVCGLIELLWTGPNAVGIVRPADETSAVPVGNK